MRFTTEDRMVRIDFFKQSGKYVCHEAVRWTGLTKGSTLLWEYVKTLHDLLKQKDGTYRNDDLIAVCMDPYYDLGHPVMVCVSRVADLIKERSKALHGIRPKTTGTGRPDRELQKQPASHS